MNSYLWSVAPWAFDVLTHLWQSTAVGLGILCVIKLASGLSARTRRTLAWIALAKFALPAAWIAHLIERAGATRQPWLASETFLLPLSLPPLAPLASEAEPAPTATQLLVILWGVVAAGLIGWWIRRAVSVRRRLPTSASPAPVAVEQRLARIARRAGVVRIPRCVVISSGPGPGLVGIVRPILMLPAGLIEMLSSAELDAILLHECVHLRRHDNFWAAVRAVVVGVLWFNPVVWWLNRVITLETEKSCDERVLELGGEAAAIASSIVAAVRHSLGATNAGFSGVTTPPIVRRIQSILAFPARRERRLVRWAAVAAAVGLVAVAGKTGSIAAIEKTAAPADVAPTAAAAAPAPVVTPSARSPRGHEATLSIDFPDEDVRNIIRNVADLFQLNVMMPETLKGKTTVKLRDVTWRQIFKIVLEPAGHDFREEGNLIKIFRTVSSSTSATPPDLRSVEEELNDAKAKLAAANEELKKLRDEHDADQARSKIEGEAAARTAALSRPKIGAIDLKFIGEPTMSEAAARALMQMRAGGDFDEITLDRDVRALYRTGQFKLIEVKHTPAGEKTFDLVFELTTTLAPTMPKISAPPPDMPAVAAGPGPIYRGLRVFEINELDQQPVPRFQARPQYPFTMRRNGVTGEVVVEFIVDIEGNVMNARAIRSSHEEFEASAVAAVSKWKFRPGRKGTRDVPTHMQVPIVFTLNQE